MEGGGGVWEGREENVGMGVGVGSLGFLSLSRAVLWLFGAGNQVVVYEFFCLHACMQVRPPGGDQNLLGGGYRPILNQVNFPGSTSQLSPPAQFQPSPVQPKLPSPCAGVGVVMLRSRTVCVVYMCARVCVVSVCTDMYVCAGGVD